MKTMDQRIQELKTRRAELELGGGKERIEKQHKGGKLPVCGAKIRYMEVAAGIGRKPLQEGRAAALQQACEIGCGLPFRG